MIIQSCLYIDEKPLCFWDPEPERTNRCFINSIDPEYFEYVVNQNFDQLENVEQRQNASLAIVANYHHLLEMFFVAICSAIQSPKYICGWFHEYDNRDLRNVIQKISNGQTLKNAWSSECFDWTKVADLVFCGDCGKSNLLSIRKNFARFWERLASEYLAQDFTDEYNSIKHGLRARMGGFMVSIGMEDVPGQLAKPENMKFIGQHSIFGTTFNRSEKLNNNKLNLTLLEQSRNFDPFCLANRSLLVAMSLRNVLTFLMMQFDAPKNELLWWKPVNDDHFNEVWRENVSPIKASFNIVLDVHPCDLYSKCDIAAEYRARAFKFPRLESSDY